METHSQECCRAQVEGDHRYWDICLWDDCHALEVVELFTVSGNVHCKRLYGNTKILIKEQGTATFAMWWLEVWAAVGEDWGHHCSC